MADRHVSVSILLQLAVSASQSHLTQQEVYLMQPYKRSAVLFFDACLQDVLEGCMEFQTGLKIWYMKRRSKHSSRDG
jgi:hypothetical protein